MFNKKLYYIILNKRCTKILEHLFSSLVYKSFIILEFEDNFIEFLAPFL